MNVTNNDELLEQLKKNILALDISMGDAPYHGFNHDNISGVFFAIDKVLHGTGITTKDLLVECEEKGWFSN